jgi:hypothetical protein
VDDTDRLIKSMAGFVTSSGAVVSRTSAKLAVLSTFSDSVLPFLSRQQCRDILPAFRDGVEALLGIMDEVPLPAEYQNILLQETNLLISLLERRTSV